MGSELVIERLGLNKGDLVLEIGHDADCDDDLRSAVSAQIAIVFTEPEQDRVHNFLGITVNER